MEEYGGNNLITNDMDFERMLEQMDIDGFELEHELDHLGVESFIQLDKYNSTFPYSSFQIWTSAFGNRYLVEFEVSYKDADEYLVKHQLHALVDDSHGTTVYTFFQRDYGGEVCQEVPFGDQLVLCYEPEVVDDYSYYRDMPGRGLPLLSSLVNSVCQPPIAYWLDDEQTHVCSQCRGGYLFGDVDDRGCAVYRFRSFMPLDRMMLPTNLWPASAKPYAGLVAKVVNPQNPKPARMLEASPDARRAAVEAEIVQFVAPFAELQTSRLSRRWERFWHELLEIPEVWQYVARPVRQAQTNYNRNNIAHILCMMAAQKLISVTSGVRLLELQPSANNNFRIHFGKCPADKELRNIIIKYFERARKHTRLR